MMLSKIDEYIMILCAWKIITSSLSICWLFAFHDERNVWVICMDDENEILIEEKEASRAMHAYHIPRDYKFYKFWLPIICTNVTYIIRDIIRNTNAPK